MLDHLISIYNFIIQFHILIGFDYLFLSLILVRHEGSGKREPALIEPTHEWT